MKALIDGDIIRYEIGFASEVGWRSITENDAAIPPWDYVEDMLLSRLEYIKNEAKANSYCLYLSEGPNFRENIAKTRPYKGNRKDAKPWHFKNITAYIKGALPNKVVTVLEADDLMAVDHIKDPDTIICSRDKDLRQVPGWFYGWELGKQPSFGPLEIDHEGYLSFNKDKNKIEATGMALFYSQCLTGDPVDNIPGLPKWGPVRTFAHLSKYTFPYNAVKEAYFDHYGPGYEPYLLEQGRLLWMTRELNEDGSPVLWKIGMGESYEG